MRNLTPCLAAINGIGKFIHCSNQHQLAFLGGWPLSYHCQNSPLYPFCPGYLFYESPHGFPRLLVDDDC